MLVVKHEGSGLVIYGPLPGTPQESLDSKVSVTIDMEPVIGSSHTLNPLEDVWGDYGWQLWTIKHNWSPRMSP